MNDEDGDDFCDSASAVAWGKSLQADDDEVEAEEQMSAGSLSGTG